ARADAHVAVGQKHRLCGFSSRGCSGRKNEVAEFAQLQFVFAPAEQDAVVVVGGPDLPIVRKSHLSVVVESEIAAADVQFCQRGSRADADVATDEGKVCISLIHPELEAAGEVVFDEESS